MERKLAAILAADVAGFSRLTSIDEEGTLHTLAAYRQTIDEFVGEHAGRIFNSAGDSVVAEFASAVQAVRCAVAIQRSLFRRNRDLPDDRRIEFRIGINLGDVVVEGGNLLGDGVNVAARLQEVAAPGNICVSGSIRDHLDGKVSFRLASLGERSLKNLPRPIAIYQVDWRTEDPATSGVLGGGLALPSKPSLAVLPFANLSGDPDQEYFADGISEDIITELSRHRWFFVVARNSSFAFKGQSVDLKQVAHALGVRYLLEGSVRKIGERVRVTAQLIEAENGAHIWAERFDRDLKDVFEIQDEITASVAGAIEPELYMDESRRAAQRKEVNLNAYECCARGMWYHYRSTRDDNEEADKWLRRSIELDPKYARSQMALARVIFGRAVFGWSDDVERGRQEIVTLAERAVALDDRDPYCHYARFAANLINGRLEAALLAAQHIIDLNPNFALGFLALGWSRVFIGHFQDAIDPLLRALRLSPHDPIAFLFTSQIALANYHLENLQEAEHFARQAVAMRRIHSAVAILAACLGKMEKLDEAAPLVDELARMEPANAKEYWRAAFPYANRDDRAKLFEGLGKAGVEIAYDEPLTA